ncbi:MAG TPA: hypothetical protein VLT32_09530 [Candidatus Sulfomarinibacteraceae bacterium]|nr:hypothetical protein [Candidatus Sulfomarinibacteraceae bacterium]
MEDTKTFPTMIIPRGTEISVNEQGQLSIRTPGNLVIQNSGVYSVIESGSGSVRIDPEVQVEAISVEAADSCFVAGELTAWRVHADKIILEKGARANIMLQESETLELDRNARLVGNFASEKELYLMLGRFSRQLRELPEGLFASAAREPLRGSDQALHAGAQSTGDRSAGQHPADDPQKTQELLALVRVIVERELASPQLDTAGREALEQLLGLVRSANLEALREGYPALVRRVAKRSGDLDKARAMLDRFFA